MQSTIASEPTSENVLAGHFWQSPDAVSFCQSPASHGVQDPLPFPDLYDPALHGVQAVPSGPVKPRSHTQS
eukprot:3937411-Rhodomonas_salina.1